MVNCAVNTLRLCRTPHLSVSRTATPPVRVCWVRRTAILLSSAIHTHHLHPPACLSVCGITSWLDNVTRILDLTSSTACPKITASEILWVVLRVLGNVRNVAHVCFQGHESDIKERQPGTLIPYTLLPAGLQAVLSSQIALEKWIRCARAQVTVSIRMQRKMHQLPPHSKSCHSRFLPCAGDLTFPIPQCEHGFGVVSLCSLAGWVLFTICFELIGGSQQAQFRDDEEFHWLFSLLCRKEVYPQTAIPACQKLTEITLNVSWHCFCLATRRFAADHIVEALVGDRLGPLNLSVVYLGIWHVCGVIRTGETLPAAKCVQSSVLFDSGCH